MAIAGQLWKDVRTPSSYNMQGAQGSPQGSPQGTQGNIDDYLSSLNIPNVPDLPKSPFAKYSATPTGTMMTGIEIPMPSFIPQGGFQAPNVYGLDIPQLQRPNMPTIQGLTGQVNQALTMMPQVGSFIPQIQELGQRQGDLLVNQLNRVFEQQRQDELERLAGRGGIDQGFSGETMRRLAESQGFTAQQSLGQLQSENLQAQVSEYQRQAAIEEQRRENVMELSAQLGINAAELESRYALQTQQLATAELMAKRDLMIESEFRAQANNLALAGLDMEAKELTLKANQLEQDRIFKQYQGELAKVEIILDSRGQLTDEMRYELQAQQQSLAFIFEMVDRAEDDDDKAEMLQAATDMFNEVLDTFKIDVDFLNDEGQVYGQKGAPAGWGKKGEIRYGSDGRQWQWTWTGAENSKDGWQWIRS